jgi:hypothetical protein
MGASKRMDASNSMANNRRNTCNSMGAVTALHWTRFRGWTPVTAWTSATAMSPSKARTPATAKRPKNGDINMKSQNYN